MNDHEDPSQPTKDWIDVKLGSLRSEMRMLFVISVAGNQLLGHIGLSTTVGYIGNGAVIAGALAIKFVGLIR